MSNTIRDELNRVGIAKFVQKRNLKYDCIGHVTITRFNTPFRVCYVFISLGYIHAWILLDCIMNKKFLAASVQRFCAPHWLNYLLSPIKCHHSEVYTVYYILAVFEVLRIFSQFSSKWTGSHRHLYRSGINWIWHLNFDTSRHNMCHLVECVIKSKFGVSQVQYFDYVLFQECWFLNFNSYNFFSTEITVQRKYIS